MGAPPGGIQAGVFDSASSIGVQDLSVSGIDSHVGDFTAGFAGREKDQVAFAKIAFGDITAHLSLVAGCPRQGNANFLIDILGEG
ncbi:hypothetical protein D3C81_2165850 [compost metagenome]